MIVPRYRVTGVMVAIPGETPAAHTQLISGAPIAIDLIVRSTDPHFAAGVARWEIALEGTIWRWHRPPRVTRLGEP